MSWHVEPTHLLAYVDGDVDHATAASIEAHVIACADCRGLLAPAVDRERLDRVWAEVVDAVDAPAVGVVERLLRRLGLRDADARLLAATPSLRLSWFAAVIGVLAFGVLAANAGAGGDSAFLLVAPIVPVVGVAAAFGPGMDPAYEIAVAAPYRALRLLLARTVAVVASSLLLAGLATMLTPVGGWAAVAWLVPALAMTSVTLALATRFEPLHAAAGVAAVWLTLVLADARAAESRAVVTAPGVQVGFLIAAAVALAVLAARRSAFDTGSTL
jgi:hypothetical protein